MHHCRSFEATLNLINGKLYDDIEEVYVIGGSSVYEVCVCRRFLAWRCPVGTYVGLCLVCGVRARVIVGIRSRAIASLMSGCLVVGYGTASLCFIECIFELHYCLS